MVIIAKSALVQFAKEHPDVLVALMEWYDVVLAADWSTINDVRAIFNSVDYVGNERFVFNIKGNRYRLIVSIVFSIRTVYIKFVGTHAAYDKINAKTINYHP
ncbi:type II toxin-antitoxin system HigB family toxin [Fibrella aquatilis]|uniref:Type II toxin-antitoxin system HigB family toxin n=1 Tax=Fibrella aquatilis TaxID=2817059 RepID=A0A939G6G2_9BACT|nr:type II toxin-antitoxin system HigB family toxin [Fibrella aquatilis]MBO0930921.1 type II toxin-antitoxin system HigB family toxin [Fibrella aquatilis]